MVNGLELASKVSPLIAANELLFARNCGSGQTSKFALRQSNLEKSLIETEKIDQLVRQQERLFGSALRLNRTSGKAIVSEVAI